MKVLVQKIKLPYTLLLTGFMSLILGFYTNFTYSPSNIYNYYTQQINKCLKKDYRACEGQVTVNKYVVGKAIGTYRPETLVEIGAGTLSNKDYFRFGTNHHSLTQRAASERTIYRNTGIYKSATLARDAYFLPTEMEALSAHYHSEKQNLVSREVLKKKFDYQVIDNTGSGGNIFLLGLETKATTLGLGSVLTTYTPLGLPKSIDSFGVLNTFTYDSSGNLWKKFRWADGASYLIESYSNYNWGIPQTVEGPSGLLYSQVVDQNGFVRSKTNSRDHTVRFEYDLLGRETLRTPHVGTATETKYPDGVTAIEKRGSRVVTNRYNSLGQEIETLSQDIARGITLVKATDYDGSGRVSFERSIAHGEKSKYGQKFTYDVLGRIRETLNVSDSSRTLFSHLSPDVVIERKPLGHEVKTYFKNLGLPDNKLIEKIEQDVVVRPTRAEDIVSTQMKLARDGKITEIKQNGISRLRYYDPQRRLIGLVDPERADISLSYYAGSELAKSRQIGSEFEVGYHYDLSGRLRLEAYPGAQENTEYTYNTDGNLTSTSSGGIVRSVDFDGNGNKIWEELLVDGHRFRFDFTYDSSDRVKTVTYPDIAPFMGGTTNRNQVTVNQIDAFGRPINISDRSSVLLSDASYHPNGFFDTLVYGNGAKTSMSLTTNQMPLKLSIQSGTKAFNLKYTYDVEGNVLSIENTGDARYLQQMNYDGLNRLVSSTFPNGSELIKPATSHLGGAITYTPTGDILNYSEFGQLPSTFSYDSLNRLEKSSGPEAQSYSYDSRGNVVMDSKYRYKYDFRGNLVSVTQVGAVSPVALYSYDGHKVRVKKVSAGVTTYYFYMNNKLFFEASPQTGIKEYFYSGNNLIATRTILKATPTPTYTFSHFNPVQSVVATSTQSLNLKREYYNSFGSSLVANPSFEEATKIRFSSHLNDDETDLIYTGNRYYNPRMARFLQMDSVDFQSDNPLTFNRYAYANNNPHKYVDPDGKLPILALAFLAADIGMISYDLYNGNYASAGLTLAMAPLGFVGSGAKVLRGEEAARVATDAAVESGFFKMFVEVRLGVGREIFPRMKLGEYYHAVYMMERGSKSGNGFWALGKNFERNLSHPYVGDLARHHYPHCTLTFCGGIRFAERGLEISGRAGRSDDLVSAIKLLRDTQKTFKFEPAFVTPGRLPPLGKY